MDFDAYRRRVGANIKRARLAAGFTQEAAGALTSSYKYLQALEAGERDAKLSTLFTLARQFNTTIAALTEVDPRRTAEARRRMATAKALPVGRKPKAK